MKRINRRSFVTRVVGAATATGALAVVAPAGVRAGGYSDWDGSDPRQGGRGGDSQGARQESDRRDTGVITLSNGRPMPHPDSDPWDTVAAGVRNRIRDCDRSARGRAGDPDLRQSIWTGDGDPRDPVPSRYRCPFRPRGLEEVRPSPLRPDRLIPNCSDRDPVDPAGRGRNCGPAASPAACSDRDPIDPGGRGRNCR